MQSGGLLGIHGWWEEASAAVVWPAQRRYHALPKLRALWSAEWSGKPGATCHRFVLKHSISALTVCEHLSLEIIYKLTTTHCWWCRYWFTMAEFSCLLWLFVYSLTIGHQAALFHISQKVAVADKGTADLARRDRRLSWPCNVQCMLLQEIMSCT